MSAYDSWKLDPSPVNMGGVLKELDPIITSEISRYSGGPVLKTKAKALTINAVKSYDPDRGANLKSWVVTQLQPLSRYRQNLQPLRVPEVAGRKAAELNRMQKELGETSGRNPTDIELADYSGVSVKRINQLRDMSKAVTTESAMASASGDNEGPGALPGVSDSGHTISDSAEEIYKGLDDRAKFIYDASTGGHGKPVMQKTDIAARLGVTPAFISQQSEAIANSIQSAHATLGR